MLPSRLGRADAGLDVTRVRRETPSVMTGKAFHMRKVALDHSHYRRGAEG